MLCEREEKNRLVARSGVWVPGTAQNTMRVTHKSGSKEEARRPTYDSVILWREQASCSLSSGRCEYLLVMWNRCLRQPTCPIVCSGRLSLAPVAQRFEYHSSPTPASTRPASAEAHSHNAHQGTSQPKRTSFWKISISRVNRNLHAHHMECLASADSVCPLTIWSSRTRSAPFRWEEDDFY